jgi:hypothetical protein
LSHRLLMKKGTFSPAVVLRWPAAHPHSSAKERLQGVWATLQHHLTDDVCEEALEVLQAVTANAIEQEKRREVRRLSNIAALEHLQELQDGGKGTMCVLRIDWDMAEHLKSN